MSRTPVAAHRPAPSGRAGSWKAAAVAVALVLVVAACGDKKDDLDGKVVKEGLGCSLVQADRKVDDVPKVAAKTKVGKEVGTKDVAKGKGCAIEATSYLTLDVVGATADDGKVFTNTFADGEHPLTARLGQGRLLTGLETGLADMKVGGRRTITIPAAQAYGKDGNAAQGIGKDEALVFVVDLVAVTDAPLYCNDALPIAPVPEGGAEGKPTEVDMPVEAPKELKTTDLVEGTGKAAVAKGNYVTVQYLGVACDSGAVFDNSWDRGEPLPVDSVGEGTITGFADGMVGMKVGGRRQIDIPAAEAYGSATDKEPDIGPNDPLTFIIEVVTIADEPPATTTTTTTTAPVDASTTVPADGATTTTAPAADASTTTSAAGDASTTTAAEATTTTAAEG